MTRARLFLLIVAIIAHALVYVLAAILITRDGGCDRSPPPDDDDMEPACKPGDKECHGAAPEAPPPG